MQNCRQVTDALLCRENPECAWTNLIGSSVFGCYAHIDEAAVKKCRNTKRRNAAGRVPPSAKHCFRELASRQEEHSASCGNIWTLAIKRIHQRPRLARTEEETVLRAYGTVSTQRQQMYGQMHSACALDNACFLNRTELVRMEFPNRHADVDHVLDMQDRCDAALSREMCEQYRNQN